MNCCFGVLLPFFPFGLVSHHLKNCWELWKLPNHLPIERLLAESHTRCGCHQSSWAAGKGLPARPWEPWERQQLQSCVREMVFNLEAQV